MNLRNSLKFLSAKVSTSKIPYIVCFVKINLHKCLLVKINPFKIFEKIKFTKIDPPEMYFF